MRFVTSSERLAALRSYDILDTAPEAAFDDVVEIARTLVDAPVALISLVDSDRQWFKAHRGTDLEGTGLENSFCAIAVDADADLLVIPDATADSRVSGMGIVTGEPHVRAYAGVLLRAPEGAALGTLCVLDVKQRGFSTAQVDSLRALARQVMAQLELRRVARERTRVAAELRDFNLGYELAMSAARLGRWDHRPVTGARFYDLRAREIMGVGAGEDIALEQVLQHIVPEDRAAVAEAGKRAMDPNRAGPLELEFRIADPRTGARRWVSAIGRTTFQDAVCTRFFGVIADIDARKRSDEARALLMGELDHRVKNILTLAQSVVDSTLRNAPDVAAARAQVAGRMQALAQAHELLVAQAWEPAPVTELVAQAMRGLSLDPARVDAQGPPVALGARPALQLALALHELATNAAKYGALSAIGGRVVVRWGVSPGQEPRFEMSWREEGGPAVVPPQRRGFGSRVIERAVAAAFNGEVELSYPPDGVRWSVSAPMSGLLERADTAA